MQTSKMKLIFKSLFLFPLIYLHASCASHLPGEVAHLDGNLNVSYKKSDIAISVKDDPGLSTAHYRGFQVSFLNQTDDWLEIEYTQVRFPKLAEQPAMLLGEKLSYYMEGTVRRNAIKQHNRDLLLGSLMGAGLATAGLSKQKDLQRFGLVTVSGTLAFQSIDSVLKSAKRAEFQELIPESHVLNRVLLPPRLSLSRWFVVELKEKQEYQQLEIAIKRKGHEEEKFVVREPAYVQRENKRRYQKSLGK